MLYGPPIWAKLQNHEQPDNKARHKENPNRSVLSREAEEPYTFYFLHTFDPPANRDLGTSNPHFFELFTFGCLFVLLANPAGFRKKQYGVSQSVFLYKSKPMCIQLSGTCPLPSGL